MDAENKIWQLLSSDPTLTPYFGSGNVSRVYDRRMQPGSLGRGTTICYQRITTQSLYDHTTAGRGNVTSPLFQFTIRDFDAGQARAARDAVIAWLGTVSFAENNDFASPVTTPPHFPNFVMDERSGMDPDIQGVKGPVYSEVIDVRLWNLES